jgi:hypothetical protein
MPAKFLGFFRGKVLFFMGVQVFFHLPNNMLGVVIIFDFKVCWYFGNLVRVTTGRTQFPFLEPIHIGECSAPGTPEDMVHRYEVFSLSSIKIY